MLRMQELRQIFSCRGAFNENRECLVLISNMPLLVRDSSQEICDIGFDRSEKSAARELGLKTGSITCQVR